jgi:hypothetical protein
MFNGSCHTKRTSSVLPSIRPSDIPFGMSAEGMDDAVTGLAFPGQKRSPFLALDLPTG